MSGKLWGPRGSRCFTSRTMPFVYVYGGNRSSSVTANPNCCTQNEGRRDVVTQGIERTPAAASCRGERQKTTSDSKTRKSNCSGTDSKHGVEGTGLRIQCGDAPLLCGRGEREEQSAASPVRNIKVSLVSGDIPAFVPAFVTLKASTIGVD